MGRRKSCVNFVRLGIACTEQRGIVDGKQAMDRCVVPVRPAQ